MRPWLLSKLLRALGILIVAVLVLLIPRPSLALRGPAEPPQLFKLRSVGGWLGVGMELDEETRRRPRSFDIEETEREFFEELKLETTSSIYHPEFILINGSVLVRLEQEDREVSPASAAQGDLDELVNEYDLNISFLSERPYNLLLFGSRTTSSIDSSGFPDYDTTNERKGALMRWRNQWSPMWLSATSTEIRGSGTSRIDEETREVTYHLEQNRGRRQSVFEYEWDERENRRSGTELTSHRAWLANYFSFGPENRSALSNTLRFRDQGGSVKHQELYGTADLLMFHRENFQTYYNYQGRLTETELEETVLHEGEVGFQHQLYENLTTNADIGGLAENSDFGESWEGRTSLEFDYVRSIPFGSVTAGVGGGFQLVEEDFTTDVGEVLDEPHTFDASNVIHLRSEFIQTSTIVVTSTSNLTLYVKDIDYRIQVVGTLSEIVRLIGGIIPDDGSVLVDYEFDRSRDRRFYTIDRQVRFGLNLFRALRLYTSLSRFNRHLIEGIERGGQDDTSRWISGVSFNKWGLHLSAEHEEYDSEINPQLTDRLRGGFALRLPFRSVLTGSASWSHSDYPNINIFSGGSNLADFTEVVGYQARLTIRPLRNLSIEGGGFFMDEEGRVNSEEMVFFGELRLHIRQLEIKVKAERRREEDRAGTDLLLIDERDRDLFNVEVIRRF